MTWQLSTAAIEGDIKAVVSQIQKGANVNYNKSLYANTPLHFAASNGYFDVVLHLLEKGANIDAVNEMGETPLSRASAGFHREVIALLIERGAQLTKI